MTSLQKGNDLYQVKLSGKVKSGVDKARVIQEISKIFNVPPEKTTSWFDGKKRTIKRGLIFEKAKQYLHMLDKIGAVAEINLLFLKNVLESSTYIIKNPIVRNAEKESDSRKSTFTKTNTDNVIDHSETKRTLAIANIIKFDRYSFSPVIFSSDKSINAYNNANDIIGTFKTAKPVIGWALLLFCSILVAFIAQYLLKGMLVNTFGGGLVTTLTVLTAFLMILLFLPKYLLPKKEICIMNFDKNDENFLCKISEVKKGTALCRYISVRDKDDIVLANIKYQLLFSEQTCSFNDEVIFSSKNEEDNAQDAMVDLCETVYEELSTLGSVINVIRSKFQGAGSVKTESKDHMMNKRIIRDKNDNIAACFYYGMSSIFKRNTLCSVEIINKSLTIKERSLLIAFSLVMAGV